MQLAVIEYARNKLKLKDAHSTEFNPTTPHPVLGLITEWRTREGRIEKRTSKTDLGGTMRLGGQECILKENSLARKSMARIKSSSVTATVMKSIRHIFRI